MTKHTLSTRDRQVIWHPFTQHGIESEILPIQSAQGAWITLEDGRKILDGISSWWVNIHGHAHPVIAQAIADEARQRGHVMLAGFTHDPAVTLVEILIAASKKAGATLTRCFYSDNGSTAVESALKIALQYHRNKGDMKRTRFLTLENAYHGDTLGCMMVSGKGGIHTAFDDWLPVIDHVPPGDLLTLESLLSKNADHYAAVIVEPLIQGVAGMHVYSPAFLTALAKRCQQRGILVICDEVFTGFYRTSTCFAFEQAAIQPDLVCLGKAITGGLLTLAATLTTEEIFSAFHSTDIRKAFLHGHTYSGNPIACRAALASWELLQRPNTQQAITRISEQTHDWINRLSQHPNAENARALGTIGALNLRNFPNYFSDVGYKIRCFAIEHGVLLRTLGSTLYVVPPYCVTPAELDQIYQVVNMILDHAENFK